MYSAIAITRLLHDADERGYDHYEEEYTQTLLVSVYTVAQCLVLIEYIITVGNIMYHSSTSSSTLK